jgi:hypothetical protein
MTRYLVSIAVRLFILCVDLQHLIRTHGDILNVWSRRNDQLVGDAEDTAAKISLRASTSELHISLDGCY